jgi:hypothetical protein
MSAQELKAKAAAEILMFEKLSKLTAVSMVKMLMSQEDKIAELEKNISMLEQYNGSVESLIKDIESHNLEQQVKGILESVEYLGWEDIYTDTCPNQNIGREFRFVAGQLTKQAKALKEGK